MNTLIGKYIVENFVNGDYVNNSLRLISRESKRYYYSETERYVRNWKDKPVQYVFVGDWAKRFVKDENNSLGFRASRSKLLNPDGIINHTVVDSPAEVKCKYTFDEVFDNDLRDIQDKEDYPLATLLREEAREKAKKEVMTSPISYKLHLFEKEPQDWDEPLMQYLREIFKVDKIYSLSYQKVIENRKFSILTKSATLFHVTHFNFEKKSISSDENYFNRTILFWLFDDKLVFQYEDGKGSW